jgi:PAS domain S-box-containing protein
VAARRREAHQKVIESATTLELVEERPNADGSRLYIQTIRTPLFDGGNKVVGVLGIFWDVTGSKRAEAELKHERFLLQTLMDKLPDRIYFKDEQSRFVRSSRAHLEMFGLKKQEEAIGKSDFDFFSDEHARQAYEDEQELMRKGETVNKEEKETWPDGSVTWVMTTKIPLRDEQGKIVGTFGISREITDRKRAEEAMRAAKESAEEASRAKSQFLASMSHELRTPLNSVIGFANILLKNRSGNLAPTEINFLERILANGKHLLALINQILDLSKIEAQKVELQLAPLMLNELVKDTVAQQEGLVRDKPVRLLVDVPERIEPMMADAEKLKQVVINLIGNALKFTERGNVTVRIVTHPDSHVPVRLDVIDTGIGIAQAKLGVIFQAFQQAEVGTARKYGGTGLGLTISQALCQLMGYRIEVHSETGKGSTFSVWLAPSKESPGRIAPAPAPKPPERAPTAKEMLGKVVLVIDDELDSRTLLSHMVEEFGCQAITANSGEQGLRMAKEFKPNLITVDLMMPELDGWQVIRALKADPELRDIPVVVVSIVAGENRGGIIGAVDVLQKPVIREDLVAALRRAMLIEKPRVLIVDDEPDDRQVLQAYLADEACECRPAANGAEALKIMDGFTPDIVLLDLMMPVMDGMTFLSRIRSVPRYQWIPVVVVTAKDLTMAEMERLRHTAQDVVKKGDVFEAELKNILRRHLLSGPPRPKDARIS